MAKFEHAPPDPFIVSPTGAVPKKSLDPNAPTEYRRIHHLSHPHGDSVNDHTTPLPVSYATFDDALRMVLAAGVRAKLAKIDIKAAFRCVPVNPVERWMLGIEWKSQFYADLALPFGHALSPALWEMYATLLEWIVRDNGVRHLIHYVDDFLTAGAADSDECQRAVDTIVKIFAELGVPINQSKFAAEASPSTTARFLGIVIDTIRMEARLDAERLQSIHTTLDRFKEMKSCSATELQSLIGTLVFAAKVVPTGRTFISRMLDVLKTRDSKNVCYLTPEFRLDVEWWRTFLSKWNGVSIIPSETVWLSPEAALAPDSGAIVLFTDACESGFGALFDTHWTHGVWSAEQTAAAKSDPIRDSEKDDRSMPYLELLAATIAVCTWKHLLRGRRVYVFSDCMPVVQAMQSLKSRSPKIVSLVRVLLLTAAQNEFTLRFYHIKGSLNVHADALSRGQVSTFVNSCPRADSSPTPPGPLPTQTW